VRRDWLVWIVLAAIYGSLLCLTVILLVVLLLLLIFDEFDVCDLRSGRWRNQEEERQHEERRHECEVEYIRAAGRFRHFNDHVRIDFATLEGCVIVSIATGVCDERDEEEDQDPGHGAAKVRFHHGVGQHHVGLHVEAVREGPHCAEDGLNEHHADKDDEIERGNNQKEKAFPRLAVVKLSQSRNDGQQGGGIRISSGFLKAAWSYGSRHLLLQLWDAICRSGLGGSNERGLILA
jgi:hypothetical protein